MWSTTYTQLATIAFSLLSSVSSAPLTSRLNDRAVSFDYSNEKVLGVNLGGWFVLEPWITPSIFDDWASETTVVDEFTYTQTLGKDEAYKRLTDHWNTWITQDDFNQIKAAGLNHVRIPIGYWAIAPQDGDPYVQGQLPVLDQAITWARSAGLKVLLDLHGAPGSQNGFDNSGRYGPITWQQGSTVSQTLSALSALSQRYSGSTDVVSAIQLLNEPLGSSLDLDSLKSFYQSGHQTLASNYVTCIHDAFQDFSTYWNNFLDTASVLLDTHQYQVFSPSQVALSTTDHVAAACALGPHLASTGKNTIVGEWTGAQTDCAKWLNGLGKGARYDGTLAGSSTVGSCDGKYTGTVAGLSNADKDNLAHFIDAQLDAYEQRTGWVFWTWKTESAPEWHMKDLLAAGLFPQPLTSRTYSGQCD